MKGFCPTCGVQFIIGDRICETIVLCWECGDRWRNRQREDCTEEVK